MKYERTDKDYGGGAGRNHFESEIFRVTHWKHHTGKKTTLECLFWNSNCEELVFDGHQEIDTDELCIKQYEPNDVLAIMAAIREAAYDDGQRDKAKEIQAAIGI